MWTINEAYDEGRTAYQGGHVEEIDCPYQRDTIPAVMWIGGYRDAEQNDTRFVQRFDPGFGGVQ